MNKNNPSGNQEEDALNGLTSFVKGTYLNPVESDQTSSHQSTNELSFAIGLRQEITQSNEGSLKQLLEIRGLTEYLLSNHTFIYGKVGFYKAVLDSIHQVANVPPEEITYLNRATDFKRKGKGKAVSRIVLLPTVSTVDALNEFISQSLNKRSVVWLVSYPSTTAKHVMLNFHNFFIASCTETEIKPLRDVVRISDEDYKYLTSNPQGGALFVSDFVGIHGESTLVKRIRIL